MMYAAEIVLWAFKPYWKQMCTENYWNSLLSSGAYHTDLTKNILIATIAIIKFVVFIKAVLKIL